MKKFVLFIVGFIAALLFIHAVINACIVGNYVMCSASMSLSVVLVYLYNWIKE